MCKNCNDTTPNDFLDDDLDDIFGPIGDYTPAEDAHEFASAALSRVKGADEYVAGHPSNGSTGGFEEPCAKCRGSGKFIGYTGRVLGDCFTCKGTGVQVFKTSAETRQKAADAKKARLLAKTTAWIEGHPEEMKWLTAASARGFNFATDMLTTLAKYGDLNEAKMNHVHRFMVQDQQREEEKAAIAARAPDITGDSLDKIMGSFQRAMERDVVYPKMRLDAFLFSLVRSGKNAGAIYVKSIAKGDDGERRYLGKIVDGRFVRSYGCTEEEQQRIIAAAMDPEAAAIAYGRREGACSICARKLTNHESIDRGIGPICAENFGW